MHNKMNRAQMYLVLIALFFLQATALGAIKVRGVEPDLGVLFVVFIAIFFGWPSALEAGLAFGLLKDIYSADIFGINAVSLAVTAVVAGLLSPKLFKESKLIQSLMVFASALFCFFMHYYLLRAAVGIPSITLGEYLGCFFIPSSLYTGLVSFFIFPFLINSFGVKLDAEYL